MQYEVISTETGRSGCLTLYKIVAY